MRKEAWGIKREKAATITLHLHMTSFREIGAIVVDSTDYFNCLQQSSCVNLLFHR